MSAGGVFANTTAVRNQGRRKAPSLFDTRPLERKRRSYAQKARATLNNFAGRLAEHGDVAKAAAQIGVSASYGRVLLQRLRASLGWQAQ